MNASTLVELLRNRASERGSDRAFTFLNDGEQDETHLTFGELERRARAVAVMLREVASPKDRAVLFCPPGLDFIAGLFGCFYAGLVAAPTDLPDPGRQQRALPRLMAVLKDTGARVLLTTRALMVFEPILLADAPELRDLRWVAIDAIDAADAADAWSSVETTPDTLALLQYTSGTTGSPRAVMLTHANLLANSALIQGTFELGSRSVGVSWLSPSHDMGLLGEILPVFAGFPAVLMSPLSFLERPLRWLAAVSRHRGTCSGGPSFAFEMCVRKTTSEQRAELDLSHWDVAFTGAEPVRVEILDRFAATFEPCGFRRTAFHPCYGLGEATRLVSGGAKGVAPVVRRFDRVSLAVGTAVEVAPGDGIRGDRTAAETAVALVGCGRELPRHSLAIVDPDTAMPCEEGRIGEVWVAGPSVGRGYWQQPGESQRTFRARLATRGEQTYLRTGDLGFLRDGELFLVARSSDVIKIRSRNYWPQDIEAVVERSHPALRPGCGAAFSIEEAEEEHLVIVHEIEPDLRLTPEPTTDAFGGSPLDPSAPRSATELDMDAVIERIRWAVGEELQLPIRIVALLRAGTIPRTSSGKIQRRACRDLLLDGGLAVLQKWQPVPAEMSPRREFVAPRVPEEEQLAHIFSEILGVPRVSVHDPFFELGGQSFHAAAVITRASEVFGVDLPMEMLFETPTVAELAIAIAKIQSTVARRGP